MQAWSNKNAIGKNNKNVSLENIKNVNLEKQQEHKQQERNQEDEEMKLTHNCLEKKGTRIRQIRTQRGSCSSNTMRNILPFKKKTESE